LLKRLAVSPDSLYPLNSGPAHHDDAGGRWRYGGYHALELPNARSPATGAGQTGCLPLSSSRCRATVDFILALRDITRVHRGSRLDFEESVSERLFAGTALQIGLVERQENENKPTFDVFLSKSSWPRVKLIRSFQKNASGCAKSLASHN